MISKILPNFCEYKNILYSTTNILAKELNINMPYSGFETTLKKYLRKHLND